MDAGFSVAVHALEGLALAPITHLATAESIARFAHAVGATDDIHFDSEAAHQQGFRDVVAPLSYYLVICIGGPSLAPLDALGPDGVLRTEMDLPATRAMAGETSVRFYERIQAGDEIRLTRVVTGVTEREGRSGRLFLVHLRHHMVNQHGEQVVHEDYTRIFRCD